MPQEKLQELISLLAGITTEEINDFLDVYKELYYNGHRGDALWGSLCDNGYTELRTVSTADKDKLLALLEKDYKKAYTGLQDINVYLITREKRDGTEEFVGIRHKLFADDLIALHHFKTLQDTEEIIHYKDGYYHYEGEATIRAECERVFGEYINTYHVNEILNHVRRSTYITREELNKDLWTLNLENGLFNIKTFEFTPHVPDMLTTIRIPVEYNSTATCPAIEKFISEVVYPEHVKLIKEMIGYCLYHDYTYQNWFLLHGEGENGKSKLLSLIGKFLGEKNISSIGLQDLNQRFAPVNLYAKSANVVADLSDADLKRTARLKQLTGGDLITAEPKFKDAFTYFNFAKLIYSCNKVPLTEDKTRAFFRRVIFIPFPNTFVIGKNADEHIMDKLTTKEELSGLLNVAIDGLKQITGNGGFTGYLTPEENEELYERASNPVYGFFYDRCEVDVEKYVSKMDLYDAFSEYCKEMRIVPFSEKKFIQEIKLLVRLEESRISVGKQRLRVWKGISIKDVHDVHDVHDFFSPKGIVENSNIYSVLGKAKGGHGGHGGHNDDYATCERCGKEATLSEYTGIGVCSACIEELKEEEKEKTNAGHCTPMHKNEESNVKDEEKTTPKEIKKIILQVGKCTRCHKEEVDLIYTIHYTNDTFKYVCGACGERIMKDYNLKLSGGE